MFTKVPESSFWLTSIPTQFSLLKVLQMEKAPYLIKAAQEKEIVYWSTISQLEKSSVELSFERKAIGKDSSDLAINTFFRNVEEKILSN